MKKTVIGLVLMGLFVFAIKLTFAQEAQPVNENDPSVINQEDVYNLDTTKTPSDAWGNSDAETITEKQNNSDIKDMPANVQGNSDITLMPFVLQDNSDNAVAEPGN